MRHQDSSATETIHELLIEACLEQLKQLGLTAKRTTQPPTKVLFCSLISGSGEGLQINALVQPDIEILTLGHPSKKSDLSLEETEDWCCEFNNQLMGRVKTKLLNRGCLINLGLPSLISCDAVEAAKLKEPTPLTQRFETKFGRLELTNFLQLDPDFVLSEINASNLSSKGDMREGDVWLF